jgi:hypothetical protein
MRNIPLKNSQTRLWIVEDIGYPKIRRLYVPYVVIHRAIIDGDECRLLLRSYYFKRQDDVEYCLRDFQDGCYIEVHAGDCHDPSTYDQTNKIMAFYDLHVRRFWFSDLGALTSNLLNVIKEWAEVTSKRWEIK